jgi:hypothetical protein
VSIDIAEPRSPGWWMNRLSGQLVAKQHRLKILEDYYTGRPPLPWGSEDSKAKFYRFQQTSRSNFAALIVQAPGDRCGVRSISTAVDHDENGDQEAWRLFTANDLDIHFSDVVRTAAKFGESYMAVAMPDDDTGQAVITAEDPRQMIVAYDPMRPRRVVAAFKIYHDDQASKDVAILWIPGQKCVATRDRKVGLSKSTNRMGGLLSPAEPIPVSFSAATFTLSPTREEAATAATDAGLDGEDLAEDHFSETYKVLDIPVAPFLWREGIGRFELHTDLLDRINHMILQRIVIATLQAFRQRAIELEEDLPERDDDGNLINYDDIFAADPGALWKLPKGAKIWESGQVDLQGILAAVKDDVLHLAAVTKTPMSMFTPDAATQTAEGASMQREGLTFEVEEFLRGCNRSLSRVISLAFKFMGDDARSDLSQIAVDFLPAERYSLAEQGSAAAQAVGSLTCEQQQRIIWQQTPAQIDQARTQRADDMLLAAHMAAVQAPAPQVPAVSPQRPTEGQ